MLLTLRLCEVYRSQNKQRLLPYATLTDWFWYNRGGEFTVRYGLSPFMKQTRLAFEGLNGQIMKCGPSAHRLFHKAKQICCR